MRLTAFALKYHRFIALLTLCFAIAGVWASTTMRREVWPAIDLETVIVEAAYPGAGPEEVERLLIQPIEKELRVLNDLRRVTSLAVEGLAKITVELEPDAPQKEQLINDIQRAVDRAEDLPLDLPERPRVREVNTRRDPVMTVALTGLSETELQTMTKTLESRLLTLPGLAKIERSGWRDQEIRVEIEPARLSAMQVTLDEVRTALARHNVNIPGGPMLRRPEEGLQEVLLRTTGEFAGPEDVAAVVVRANDLGQVIRIGDLAMVDWRLADPTTFVRADGARAVLLHVLKRPRADAVALARTVRATVQSFLSGAAMGLRATFPDDFAYYVERRLTILCINGAIGLVLVLAILFVFLSPQFAWGAALGIPIALGTALAILAAAGASLNPVTIFGLIMCLGMLVDEDIVIAENIHRHLALPGEPRERIAEATADLARPLITTALTTVAAFLPLLFVAGIIGKFVRWIPWVVIVTLVASLTEALVLLPTHLYHLVRRIRSPLGMRPLRWLDRLRDSYLRSLQVVLDHRRLAGLVLALLLTGGALFARFGLPFLLFPPHGVEFFFLRAEAQIGTSLATMERLIEPIESAVVALPSSERHTFVTTVGAIQEEPNDPLARYGSHLAQIAVYLHPGSRRKRSAEAIIAALREQVGLPPGLTGLSVARVSTGPYVGRPVAVELRGDDPAEIMAAAGAVQSFLAGLPGVHDAQQDQEPGKRELRITVDEGIAMRAGFSLAEVGRTIRAIFAGETATTIRRGEEEIDVVVRYPEQVRSTPDGFAHIWIANSQRQLTPLSAVAHLEEAVGQSAIRHADFKRAITVTAEIDERITTPLMVHRAVESAAPRWAMDYPHVVLRAGGEIEESRASLRSTFWAMGLSMLLILAVLLAATPSTAGLLAVLATIPLGALGMLLGFVIQRQPLSFMALFGTIGLFGVIVDGALIIVMLAERMRREGQSAEAAIVNACRIRFRPIVLVTLATVLALLPTAYGIGGSDGLIQPAALAMDWGLPIGTALALFVTPIIYVSCIRGCNTSFLKIIVLFFWCRKVMKSKR
ncbi:MAG: efflux RND transporter permease subunit [Deltaproteobacteria bacterium]|nr:efflux RND transporter permease subunit [Deltaproteobacteria bacterium]